MASEYPGTIATIPANKEDDTNAKTGADEGTSSTTGDHAAHHNKLAEEVVAIQTELGLNPRGPFATVRERIEARDFKRSCKAATTAPLPASTLDGGGTVLTATANGVLAAQDGITLSVGDRFFVKDQIGADAPENGIYEVTSLGAAGAPWVLTRPTDADIALKVSDAMYVGIEQGTLNSDTLWELISDNPITLGTTALRFTRIYPSYRFPYRDPWMPTGLGGGTAKYESMERSDANSNVGSLASGRLSVLGGIVLRAGVPVNGITFFSATTAANTPTHQWFALIRQSDRVYLRSTVNGTTGAWNANSPKRLALSSAYTPDVDTPVYVGCMVVATAVPTLMGKTLTLNAAINALVPVLSGTSSTGLTTPVADGTIAGVVAGDRNAVYFAID